MFLSVKEMERRKVRFDVAFQPGQIDFSGEDLAQATPLEASGSAVLTPHSDGEVHITGHYRVELTAKCDRCLGLAKFPLEAGFDLYYRPGSNLGGGEEVEIGEEEAEIGFYLGDGLELVEVLQEQILLALPMQRVCGDACKGICPVCGKNRNESDCGCKAEPADVRWDALRNIVN
jgi:uncharacterized protein